MRILYLHRSYGAAVSKGMVFRLLGCGLLLGALQGEHAVAQMDPAFTYQGQLQEDGLPANGTYDLLFILYDSEVGGSQVGPIEEIEDVAVTDGLFQVELDFGAGVFVGQPRWLEVGVRDAASTGSYSTLSSRQAIQPAPYAIGLRPGARLQQVATGTALRADSTEGIGFAGLGQVYGVYGRGTGPDDGSGYGGYFESSTGIGVHGRSSATRSTQSPEAPGVHGWSQHGVGVFGESDSTFGTGVRGQVATGNAVYGRASGGFGILGTSPAFAVRGHNSASTAGEGYGGYFSSTTGTGVYGETTAAPATQNSMPAGVKGRSQYGAGILGEADSNFVWGGYFRGGPSADLGHVRIDGSLIVGQARDENDDLVGGDLFVGRDATVQGDLSVGGSKGGYVVDMGINAGIDILETGEVVVVVGFDEPILGEIPLVKVDRAESANSSGVIGIVDKAHRIDEASRSPTVNEMTPEKLSQHGRKSNDPPGISPGDYLKFVTLGAYKSIKADASYGAISPGDLLVSSPNPGHAMRADNPATGTVVGKALGELDAGTGTIPVMVTLH
jgi:hypothetical protein